MRRKLLWFAIDILAAALTLLTVWYFNYMIPQKGIPAVSAEGLTENADGIYSVDPGSLQQTNVVKDTTDWHEKFADQFTDTVVATDTSYTSPDLSIHLTYDQYDTGKWDLTDAGNHVKYGTKISYVLADIYVGDITCLQTAFAQDTG